ncbi:MAG TPA: chromate transporter [Longimicrobiales bacterium]|nr:chromate transporter [Longimicrobiales bacterium]
MGGQEVADGPGAGPRRDGDGATPSLAELVRTYLKISLLGFGGPNAHLALMLDEVVERRGWITRERFLEIVALTNLLPGPNSSEVAIHVGYTQRGWPGALATGLTFLVPTFVMVTALSAVYFRFGALPQVEAVFWGLQPVIVAVVLSAGWKIGRAGVKTPLQAALATLGAAVSLVSGQAVIAVMALGGLVTWWAGRDGGRAALHARGRPPGGEPPEDAGPGTTGGGNAGMGNGPGNGPAGPERRGAWLPIQVALAGSALGTLGTVFLTHLWIGAVLFGGGYVLVALLEPWAVDRYGWVTGAQFLDGVALTQAVPGPISTLSAFVGYAAGGVPGAFLGTAGIYLPAFLSVLWVAPRLERVREVEAVRRALTGVVAGVAGAVVGVGASLVTAGVRDPWTAAIALVALALATWRRVPALWLVAGGLVAGFVRMAVG